MTLVSFKKELYGKAAIDGALQAFADHAQLSLAETDTEWRIEVKAEEQEELLVDELCNFALGLTIEQRGGP